MLYSLSTVAYQGPSQVTAQSRVQTPASVTTRTSMPSLPEPPRHLLPELGRRLAGHTSTLKHTSQNGSTLPVHADLPPFACGLTGTSVEVMEPRQCEVEGTVPLWLQGDLYRNGPGVWDIETKGGETYSVAHWYGLRKAHGVSDPAFALMIHALRHSHLLQVQWADGHAQVPDHRWEGDLPQQAPQ